MPIFRKYFILNLSTLLFLSLSVFGQKELILTDNQLKFELGNEYFSIYEDRSAALSFEEIRKQPFRYDASNSLNFGYSTSKFWIKCRIKNQTKSKWLFAILASLVDEFEFYEILNDGTHRKRVSGDKYPHSEREEDLPVFSFLMDIPEGETRRIMIL